MGLTSYQLEGESNNLTIGILGDHTRCTPYSDIVSDIFAICKALQGAFAEHQAMLQKLSLKRNVVAPLVRTVEDLDLCDALIIPGGGKN